MEVDNPEINNDHANTVQCNNSICGVLHEKLKTQSDLITVLQLITNWIQSLSHANEQEVQKTTVMSTILMISVKFNRTDMVKYLLIHERTLYMIQDI